MVETTLSSPVELSVENLETALERITYLQGLHLVALGVVCGILLALIFVRWWQHD